MLDTHIDSIEQIHSILFIINPTSKNGAGAKIPQLIEAVMGDISLKRPEITHRITLTDDARHAVEIAASAAEYDLVVASGGDGVIHEVVNGLMSIEAERRPILGIIPVGTGNDFMRTVHMSPHPKTAIAQLLDARPVTIDVGRCNDEYYVETLSFGLDAAIALDTVERRRRTGRTGTIVFAEAGVDILLHHLESHLYRFTAYTDKDEVKTESGEAFILAIQNGRTYGGGFAITPDADPSDGLFDVCVAGPPLSPLPSLFIFLLAKFGQHTRFKQIHIFRMKKIEIHFEKPPPAQIDGELITGTDFTVDIIPQALRVLMPRS
jgi:YegS/Rv2252/BmrU family lipid kinase